MNIKIIGKNEGFRAEYLIEKYLHCKKINELEDTNLKKFILFICKDNNIQITDNLKIQVKNIVKNDIKIKGSLKTDKIISINEKDYRISIKTGKGNAFHQEPRDSFVNFLKDKLNIDDKLINLLDEFLEDKKVKIKNTDLSKFFQRNKLILINRVLSGRYNESSVDYYIFCPQLVKEDTQENKIKKIEKCKFIKKNALIDYLNTHESKGSCPVGRLNFQAYNRKKGTAIQFKWGNCYDDIK